jgi:hypothetical protein
MTEKNTPRAIRLNNKTIFQPFLFLIFFKLPDMLLSQNGMLDISIAFYGETGGP